MTPTPEMLALAREIAADGLCRREKWLPGVKAGIHEEIIAGKHDSEPLVIIALDAIQRTTELAAAQAERLMTGSDADFKCAALAHAYRNFAFLKGATQ